MPKLTENDIKELKTLSCQVRKDILSMIHTAKSGHPGGSLSAADVLTVLYSKCMNHFPDWDKNPDFEKRDRFVLSKGHASATLYSILARLGYFPVEELKTFRELGTRLQGHPSAKHLPGIEVSTGSLGQGLSIACGIALGLKLDKNPAFVYAYMGDGELQEGNIWEGVMNAAHHKLDNLIAFVDRNCLQIDGSTECIKSLNPLPDKFIAFGWEVIEIDGHDHVAIYDAIIKAKTRTKPTVIIASTTKGKGVCFMENCAGWHGKAPSDSECDLALSGLDN